MILVLVELSSRAVHSISVLLSMADEATMAQWKGPFQFVNHTAHSSLSTT